MLPPGGPGETAGPAEFASVMNDLEEWGLGVLRDETWVHPDRSGEDRRPAFVLHEHRRPRHHFDLRLEEDGVLRSWAVPRGLPEVPGEKRLAVAVPDHELDHLTYEDEDKSIADIGWWEEHDRSERRILLTLHGRDDDRRYALIRTSQDWLLHRLADQ